MNVFDKREQTSLLDLPSTEKVRASEEFWKKDIDKTEGQKENADFQ